MRADKDFWGTDSHIRWYDVPSNVHSKQYRRNAHGGRHCNSMSQKWYVSQCVRTACSDRREEKRQSGLRGNDDWEQVSVCKFIIVISLLSSWWWRNIQHLHVTRCRTLIILCRSLPVLLFVQWWEGYLCCSDDCILCVIDKVKTVSDHCPLQHYRN